MSVIRAIIHAGVCGFVTEVTATGEDKDVQMKITSPCENIRGLASALPDRVDAYQEIGDGFDGELWTAMRGSLRGCCSGCVVPAAIFKSMQVAGGIALPGDPTIHIERIEEETRR